MSIDIEHLKGRDVFRDAQGNLWRVTAQYRAPTVQMERVDWSPPAHNPNQAVGWVGVAPYMQTRPTLFGTVDGAMWEGFELLEPIR